MIDTNGSAPSLDQLQHDLEAFKRRDRRQVATIVAGMIIMAALIVAVFHMAATLERRNEVIDNIEDLTERQECTDLAEARFEDALAALVVAEDPAELKAARDELAALDPITSAIDRCPDG